MLDEIFKSLDLRAEETLTYLALLESGGVAAGELARRMALPRPSVYGYLQRLTEAGLVRQSLHHNIKIFVPEPPAHLRRILQRKIESLHARQRALDLLIPDLEKRGAPSGLKPKLQFFEGASGLESMLEDLLAYPDSETYSFWPIKAAMSATSMDFYWYLNKERVRNRIYTHAIWPRLQAVDVKRYPFMGSGTGFYREIRIAPDDIDFTMGYWVYADKVMVSSSREESFGFRIESAEFAQLMKTQHQAIWKISAPFKTDPKDTQRFLDEIEEEEEE